MKIYDTGTVQKFEFWKILELNHTGFITDRLSLQPKMVQNHVVQNVQKCFD